MGSDTLYTREKEQIIAKWKLYIYFYLSEKNSLDSFKLALGQGEIPLSFALETSTAKLNSEPLMSVPISGGEIKITLQ